MIHSHLLRCLAAIILALFTTSARAQIPFQPGDTIILYGNSMVERLMEHGELEALIHLSQPGKNLRFRSLAWTGDEVANRLRAEGYAAHMKELLEAWPAKVVILGFGLNESFAGPAGLPAFANSLSVYLDQTARLHPGARIVLLSPIAIEGADAARNAEVQEYAKVIAQAAQARSALYVDLFSPTLAAYSPAKPRLTTNSIHLNAEGNSLIARRIASALVGDAAIEKVNPARLAEVAPAAAQLAGFVSEVVRPRNGILYYGQRKRPDERAAEMPLYMQRIEKADALVHQLAASPTARFADAPFISLPLPPLITKGGSARAVGDVKTPAAMQAEFKVADGYEVNLFASEEQFPDLRAPVQIAFDARGRLWVVTMPSFPHTLPGQPRQDKILILEDTDRDGKADKSTIFAGDFDALDGIAFSDQGALILEQSTIWLMRDTDGDGRADLKTEFLRGLDLTDTHHGGMIATDPVGDVWFSDGVFHRSQIETPFGVHRGFDSTTYRLNPRTGRVSTEWQSITPNPWNITFDRHFNAFQMYGDGLVLDGLALTWTPLGVYHPFAHAVNVNYGKGSGLASISSPNFPDQYQQGMASASLIGPYAVSLTQYDYSAGLVRGHGRLDVLSSPNPGFRPADVEFGFDGALYVSDYSSAIVGHAQYAMRDPRWNHTKGRIWRVVHKGKPIVKDWPRIEGASAAELCKLLLHPQDIVRHHARIELRKLGAPALAELDKWVATQSTDDQAHLEAHFIAQAFGQTRPDSLAHLIKSESPQHRAAAIHLIRLQPDRLPTFAELLTQLAADPHPRVKMEVLDAIAHLRPAYPQVEQVIKAFHAHAHGDAHAHAPAPLAPAVKRMLDDLAYGTQPRLAASVPVLQIAPDTRLAHWQNIGGGTYRTFVQSDIAQPAILALKHSFLDVSLNTIQVLSFDSQWTSEQQTRLELEPGLNVIDITYRNLRSAPPPVHLFSPVGERLTQAQIADTPQTLQTFIDQWLKANAELGLALRVQAVPNAMQFAPRQLRVTAGAKVRIIFDNPDLMLHNLLILAPDSLEEIGALADKMAADPAGLAKGFIPDSPKVLHATPLVEPRKRVELVFTAPAKPGNYPYVCTFPGHWRIMSGLLIVEAPSMAKTRLLPAAQDGFETSIPAARLLPVRTQDRNSNPGGGRDASALFNGTTRNAAGAPGTTNDGKTFRGYGRGDWLTLTLDTAKSPAGYDLTQIITLAGHGDQRAGQNYSLLVALASNPDKFIPLTTVKIINDSGASEARIALDDHSTLPGASGVVAIRFEFQDGPLGYHVYREISIVGTPTKAK